MADRENLLEKQRGALTVAKVAGIFSAATGLLVLFGWALDVAAIRSVLPGAVQMKANTALGLLCSGIALAVGSGTERKGRILAAQILGALVTALGLATVCEYAYGWNLGIDELLFRDRAVAFNAMHGRMSPYTACVFAAVGVGLAAAPGKARWVVWASGGLALLVGAVSVAGYIWNASELVTDRFVPPVAINTALAFVALGIGMFARTVERGRLGFLSEYTTVEVRTLGGFTAMFAVAFAIGGFTYRTAVEAVESAGWVAHTQQARGAVSRLSSLVSDAELAQRDYFLTGDRRKFEACERASEEARKGAEALAQLVADNPAQKSRALNLQRVVVERLATLRLLNESFERKGGSVGNGTDAAAMENIRTLIKVMDSNEASLLAAREAAASEDKVKTLVLLLASLALSLAGFLTFFGGIHREMAKRLRGERMVLERSEQLEAANKELEAFSYSVSHDLRAPLRHIQGYSEMLKLSMEGPLADKTARYLGIIQKSTVDMGRLIDDLLAFSRLGRQDLHLAAVPLGPIVAAAVETAKLDAGERAIKWKIAELPSVNGDAALLKQVFVNLIGNAVKYSRERNPAVVEVGVAGRTNEEVTIFVKDNGAGFDMAYAQKLFGVFHRLHSAEEFEGSGIGLAIVQRIVTRHGGRIWGEGEVGKGAMFCFTLRTAGASAV